MMIHEYLEAVPSRMVALVKLLIATGRKGLKQVEAEMLLQPTTLRAPTAPPSTLAPRTIAAAIDIGVIVTMSGAESDRIGLSESAFESFHHREDLWEAVAEWCGDVLLADQIGGKPNGFAEIVAWMLLQPTHWMPQGHHDVQSAMIQQGMDINRYRMNNTSCLDNVIYWARFLGVLWKAEEGGASGIMPDPTDYLRPRIQTLIEDGERIDATEFCRRVTRKCSVLDRGAARAQMLSVVATSNAAPWPKDRLSDSMSLALRQLASTGEIRYGCPNDARDFLRMSGEERVAFVERPAQKVTKTRSAKRSAKVPE